VTSQDVAGDESEEEETATPGEESADEGITSHTDKAASGDPTPAQAGDGEEWPHGQRVTFRSVTLAKICMGQEIDALSTALEGTEWVEVNEQFAAGIVAARQADAPYKKDFLLLSDPETSPWYRMGYGLAHPPDGIDWIVGQFSVLGPSMVALMLTFVLTDAEAGSLDMVLREEVHNIVRRAGRRSIRVKSAYQIKYERIQAVREDVSDRCLDWLEAWAPGTLRRGDRLGVPLCSLITPAQGNLFEHRPEGNRSPDYLRLLDLVDPLNALRFRCPSNLFLKRRIGQRPWEYVAAFSEEASTDFPNLEVAPEQVHQALFPYMIVLALESVLSSLESRMRRTRLDLAGIDVSAAVASVPLKEKLLLRLRRQRPEEPSTVGLRNRLLALSRDIAIASGDIKGVLDDRTSASLWAEYPPLLSVDPSEAQPSTRDPAEIARRNMAHVITNLKSQETELRELVIVTSEAVSQAQDKQTQASLNRLTIWLVVCTVALVGIGIFTLWKTFYDTPDSPAPKPSVSTSTPSVKPSIRPTSTSNDSK
jgi:hypothetical protein